MRVSSWRGNGYWAALAALVVVGSLVGCQAPAARKAAAPRVEVPREAAVTPADEGKVKPVAQRAAKPIRIAVLGLENNPFWIPVKAGALAAARELKPLGATVEWVVPGDQHTSEVFGQALDTAVAKHYDAIATIAGDQGMVPFINRAADAGVAVATFNSETAKPNKRLFFVGADLYHQGEVAGETMAKLLGPEGGKVGIITGFFAVEAHELRRKAFEETLKARCPKVAIVGRMESQDKADLAYGFARDYLTANPDLAGIFVAAGGPDGAAKAVEEAGKTGKVKIVCFDFIRETLGYVRKGVISATIGQDPYAQGHDPAVRLYNYLVAGVKPEAPRLLTRSDVITRENVDTVE